MENTTRHNKQNINKKFIRQPTKKKIQPNRTPNRETFDTYYDSLINRKDMDFCIVESPNFNKQIEDFEYLLSDKYKSALNTPVRVLKTMQRKKYMLIKQKLAQDITQYQKENKKSLQESYTCKQQILRKHLNQFTDEIEKECKEKGQIVKYIWNTMFNMIEQISDVLANHMKKKEKQQISSNLKTHQQYQQLIQTYRKKQLTLNQKSIVEKTTIKALVNELRFKRKEVQKLYRNQKLLINKLNDLKSDHLHLQNNYIDLMSSIKDLPQEKVQMLMKARQQINKNHHIRLNILGNRKHNKKEISQEINEEQTDLDYLYQEINQIANNQFGSPELISTLISATLENFCIKNDDIKVIKSEKIFNIQRKLLRMNAQTQISQQQFKQSYVVNQITQFDYKQKIDQELISHKNTQTFCQLNKIIIKNQIQSQCDEDYSKKVYVKECFKITMVYQDTFCYRPKTQTCIRINSPNSNPSYPSKPRKTSIKHSRQFSDLVSVKDSQIEENQNDSSSNSSINDKIIQSLKSDDLLEEPMMRRNMKKKNMNLSRNSYFKKANKSRFSTVNSNFGSTLAIETPSKQFPNRKSKKISIIKIQQFQNSADSEFISKKSSRQMKKNILRSSFASRSRNSNASRQGNSQQSNRNQNHQHNYNIEIDELKEKEIENIFLNKQFAQMNIEDDGDYDDFNGWEIEQQLTLKQSKSSTCLNQKLMKIGNGKVSTGQLTKLSNQSPMTETKQGLHGNNKKYNDENDIILKLCRDNYDKKGKKIKDKMQIFKYRDQFASVREKIQFIAKDVRELVQHKQPILKKSIDKKNLKNTYKILMTTFAKAYDRYSKGILLHNLIFPLFQSFALIYGAINTNQIYKKMTYFIACLSVNTSNTIMKFFLFFLGLDTKSPYSQKVTISEVYLCLKLLEKISIDGKITLNIESIYTDTIKIKQQLLSILSQQKIPDELSKNIEKRVTDELEKSQLFRNSSQKNSHLKINIYNIILLICQQVIKCKAQLKESFTPFLQCFQQYKQQKKLPVIMLQVLLTNWKSSNFTKYKLKALLEVITKNGRRNTITIDQFCSILFECNLVKIEQLYERSLFVFLKNWQIPRQFIDEINTKIKNNILQNNLQKKEISIFLKIRNHQQQNNLQHHTLEKMKKLIFEKHYERKVEQLLQQIIGNDLMLLLKEK